MIRRLVVRFIHEDQGQDLIEYAFLAVFIALAVAAVLQTVAIAMYLIPIDAAWWSVASEIVMGAAVVLTVVTGIDYVGRALRLRRGTRG